MLSFLERRVPVVGGGWLVGCKPNLVISDELINKKIDIYICKIEIWHFVFLMLIYFSFVFFSSKLEKTIQILFLAVEMG